MADLIQFPGRRRAAGTTATYQLRLFEADDGVRPVVTVLARDDAEARRRAQGLTEGLRAELWSGGRLVEQFPPLGFSVAGVIRPLSDPAG